MMLVTTPGMFYFLRFLLGVFEAGFYPGIVLYLTYWYSDGPQGEGIRQCSCRPPRWRA